MCMKEKIVSLPAVISCASKDSLRIIIATVHVVGANCKKPRCPTQQHGKINCGRFIQQNTTEL